MTITLNKKDFLHQFIELQKIFEEKFKNSDEIKVDIIEEKQELIMDNEDEVAYKIAIKELKDWEAVDFNDYLIKRWLVTN